MKRMRFCAAVLACLIAQPALAQQMRQDDAAAPAPAPAPAVPPPPAATPQQADAKISAINADMAAFGAWVLRLNQAFEPSLGALKLMQAKWPQILTAKSPGAAATIVRPTVIELRSKLAQSRVLLAALDQPHYPNLPLPEEVRPAALVATAGRTLDRISAFGDGLEALVAAMASGNAKAIKDASGKAVSAGRLLFDTQRTMMNAFLAISPPDKAQHDGLLVYSAFLETGARIMTTGEQLMAGRTDPQLPADLDRLAASFAEIGARGARRVDNEIAQLKGHQARVDPSSDGYRLLAKAIAAAGVQRDTFTLSTAFGQRLRESAAEIRKSPRPEVMMKLATSLAPMSQALEQIGVAQARIMAE